MPCRQFIGYRHNSNVYVQGFPAHVGKTMIRDLRPIPGRPWESNRRVVAEATRLLLAGILLSLHRHLRS